MHIPNHLVLNCLQSKICQRLVSLLSSVDMTGRGGSGSYVRRLYSVPNSPLSVSLLAILSSQLFLCQQTVITISLIVGVPAVFRGLIPLNLCPSLPLLPPSLHPSLYHSLTKPVWRCSWIIPTGERLGREGKREKKRREGENTKSQMTKPNGSLWEASSANTCPILMRREQSNEVTQ